MKYQEFAQRFPHMRGLPIEGYECVEPKQLLGLNNLRPCVPLKVRKRGPRDPIGGRGGREVSCYSAQLMQLDTRPDCCGW